MMLGSKGILTPLIPDCSVLRTLTILKKIRNPLIFLRKMATYSCFLAGPKFRNLPASKLASDFRPFDPGIIILLYHFLMKSSYRFFSALLNFRVSNHIPAHSKIPARLIHFPAESPGAW